MVGRSSIQWSWQALHRSDQLDDGERMGVEASPTASALTSSHDPRRGSILAHILLGRKPLGCGHARKCVNVDAVFPVSAMPNCETALAAGWMSNLLPTAGTVTYQQAKLRRWGLAILLSAPSLDVGQELQVRADLRTFACATPHN